MQTLSSSPYTNSVFEQLWWLEAVAPDVKWQEHLIKDGDKVKARWVTPLGTFFMPHLTQTIGFWINPEIVDKDRHYNVRKEIVSEIVSSLPANTHISLAPENSYYLPLHWAGFTVRPYATYRINDLSNIDALYASFASVVKKNIKSAKNKVKIEESGDIAVLHSLMEKTFQLQKRSYPFSKEYLSTIFEACKKHDAAKLLYARDENGNVHSGVLYVYDEKVCYYLIAGTDPQFRSGGANSLLLWEGIQFAAQHSRCFDFEGSMIEGIEKFFRQFGGELTIYYDVFRLSLLKDVFQIIKPRIKKLLHYK